MNAFMYIDGTVLLLDTIECAYRNTGDTCEVQLKSGRRILLHVTILEFARALREALKENEEGAAK